MKRARNIEDMELGNLLFGHSRGTYHVTPRKAYQDIFCRFLEKLNFDSYGNCYQDKLQPYVSEEDGAFENDTCVIRPYYWGDDENIMSRPNFVYKPSNLTISWYKYPMRDAYASHNITPETFKEILEKCNASIKALLTK